MNMLFDAYSYYRSAPPSIVHADLRNWVVRRQISDRFTGLFAEKEQSYKQRYVDTYLGKPELAELRQRIEDCPPIRDAGHLLETLTHLYGHRALTFYDNGNVRVNVNMFNNSRADRELLSALVTFAGAAQSLEGEALKENETNKKFPSGMVNLRYENGLEIELGFIAAQGLEGFARSQMKPKDLEKQYNSEIHSLIRSAGLSIDEAVADARRERQEAVTNARGNVERKKAELELKELEFGAVRDGNPFYRNFHLGLLRVDVTNAAQGLWNQTVGRLTGAHVTAPGPVRHMIKIEQRETELVREKISEARSQLNAAMGEVNRAYEETVKEIYEKYKGTPPVETKFSTLGEYATKRFTEPFQKGAKKLAKDLKEAPGKMMEWGGERASGMVHMVADPIGDMLGGVGERVQRSAAAIGLIPGELLNRLEGQPRGGKLEEFLALKEVDPEKAREMLSIPARQRDVWRDARAQALAVTRDAVREGLPSYMGRMLPERDTNPRNGSKSKARVVLGG